MLKCKYLRILHVHGDLPAAGTAGPAGGVPDGRSPTAAGPKVEWVPMASMVYGHLLLIPPARLHALGSSYHLPGVRTSAFYAIMG